MVTAFGWASAMLPSTPRSARTADSGRRRSGERARRFAIGCLVNKARTSHGLRGFAWNRSLARAAGLGVTTTSANLQSLTRAEFTNAMNHLRDQHVEGIVLIAATDDAVAEAFAQLLRQVRPALLVEHQACACEVRVVVLEPLHRLFGHDVRGAADPARVEAIGRREGAQHGRVVHHIRNRPKAGGASGAAPLHSGE